jgi:tight adherence protein B
VLVTAQLPTNLSVREGTVSVAIDAGGETYTGEAFVPLTDGQVTETAPEDASPTSPALDFVVSKEMMLGGLAAAGLGILLLLLSAFGVFGGGKRESVEDRIAAYSRSGGAAGSGSMTQASSPAASQGLAGSAVGMAEKALAGNQDFAASVGSRLEAAGMSLKPAEWLLMHAGIAMGAGLVGFLLSSGDVLMMVLFLLGGAVLPWVYLGFKRSRRVSAFNNQLADTLQLISGGLSAGLSLAQSIDTVVRQGSEPMTTEFKRALMEARLGVSIEDALESIAERMQSKDFKWVVIAVRIQREVGGNLSEVLGQVAATIRERAYLQRQVKSLSAEGKMSAWILGLLPIVVFVFLMLTNRAYFEPMLTSVLGMILLGVAVALITTATFWMRKLVRMEV